MISTNSKNSYHWIPSSYFMQGLPFGLVAIVSSVLYKELGFNNSSIAFYTSLFTLPWVLKAFFSPALEKISTKRTWALLTQFSMAMLILVLAFIIYHPHYLYLTGLIFFSIAIASALHDINVDGLYLDNLDPSAQAKWIGIRSLSYQLGKLLGQGGMVYLVGIFALTFTKAIAWSLVCSCLTITVILVTVYNYKKIPLINKLSSNNINSNIFDAYKEVYQTLKKLPHLSAVLIFILFYNFPESQLIKIIPLFMLDNSQHGGLNLSIADVGIIYGSIGMIGMLIGVTLSGYLLNKFTLKKCLIPFTLFATLSNFCYLFLLSHSSLSIWQLSLCIIIPQFFYGLSNGAYMLYLIQLFAKEQNAMSLYTIGTAFMLLGIMFAGSIAGYMQSLLGYTGFFIWVLLSGIGIIGLAIYSVRKILF